MGVPITNTAPNTPKNSQKVDTSLFTKAVSIKRTTKDKTTFKPLTIMENNSNSANNPHCLIRPLNLRHCQPKIAKGIAKAKANTV